MNKRLLSGLLGCVCAGWIAGCSESAQEAATKDRAVKAEAQFDMVPAPMDEMQLAEEVVPEHNTEEYDSVRENAFVSPLTQPLSTFSIDVDTASYANIRRMLNEGRLPPAGAVRIEEMVNYFPYDYPPPSGDEPFSIHLEMAACPWNPQHRLARIGLRGKDIAVENRPSSNLVFLLDVSGSMNDANKLPWVRIALNELATQLTPNDRVAIVVYASSSGLVLPSTLMDPHGRREVQQALNRLNAGGSTNGGQGIQLAYSIARENLFPGGNNRVILCTDGDFNVGVTDRSGLVKLVESNAKSGIDLTILGFGAGNFKDASMEELTNKGNGNYAYIDSLEEIQKVLGEDLQGTLITIARDVKIQVDFNPDQVQAYRLIGYENRLLNKEDFNDDTKDAGDIGAGHTVTAFYEIVPPGVEIKLPAVEPSKYQEPTGPQITSSQESFTVRLRYKLPGQDDSQLIKLPLVDEGKPLEAASPDFRFAGSVAAFGMHLRKSEYLKNLTLDEIARLASENKGNDLHGYRAEFLGLIQKAMLID